MSTERWDFCPHTLMMNYRFATQHFFFWEEVGLLLVVGRSQKFCDIVLVT